VKERHLWEVLKSIPQFRQNAIEKKQAIIMNTIQCRIRDVNEEVITDVILELYPKSLRRGHLTKEEHAGKQLS
jgi:hypothetical protein